MAKGPQYIGETAVPVRTSRPHAFPQYHTSYQAVPEGIPRFDTDISQIIWQPRSAEYYAHDTARDQVN